MPVSIKQVTDAISAALKPVQDAVTALRTDVDALKPLSAAVSSVRSDVLALQSDAASTATTLDALNADVAALESVVYVVTDPPPVPDPVPQPDDWATRVAGRMFARRLASADATDANLAARHPNADVCVWTPDSGLPGAPDNYTEPTIDPEKQALCFPIETGKGSADWVFRIPPMGANSHTALEWSLQFNQAFIGTTFRTASGGYPGIKLGIVNIYEKSSTSPKLVVSTVDQHKFPYLYRYNWQNGDTENIETPVGTLGASDWDFDWQPKQGQPATCLLTVADRTPQGQAVPGCDTLVADEWITFNLEVDTGDLIPGTSSWDCEMRLYMTIGGVRKLIVDYGKTSRGYHGRRAEPWTGVWLVPYMTDRDLTQTFPSQPKVWLREVSCDNKPIIEYTAPQPEPQPIPDPVPVPTDPVIPEPGTFREFTTNTPASVGATAAILANYVGGAFVPDYGTSGGVAYHGGGEHFSNPDFGGVLVLDCAQRKYVMRNLSSVTTHKRVQGTGGSPTDRYGAYLDNGYPQSTHTYNCLTYMPESMGGGPEGSLVRVMHSGGDQYAPDGVWNPGFAATWKFDLSQDVDGHSRLSGDNPYFIYRDKPTVEATTDDSSVSCLDTKREGYWSFARTPSAGRGLSFTHKTGQVDNWAGPPLNLARWASMHYMADDDLLCVICDEPTFGTARFGIVKLLKLDPLGQWVTVTPTVPNDPAMQWGVSGVGAIEAGICGAQWSTLLGGFVSFDYGSPYTQTSTIRIWVLTPPPTGQRFTGTWSWRVESVTSADGSVMDVRADQGSGTGPYGKLVECPALKSLVWTRRVDKPGQLIRLQGM